MTTNWPLTTCSTTSIDSQRGFVPAITYPIAQTAVSKNADDAAFIAYLGGPDATKQFEHFGFTVLASEH